LTSHFIQYKRSRIHYRVSGSGPRVTVCLHGFGEFARTFDPLSAALPDYTLVAIDLPWHGETVWQEGLDMELADLMQIIRDIPQVGNVRFGLMGYSMGGRICLSLFEAFPAQVDFLLLIAPDGLKINPWYRFATQTRVGNQVFRSVMERPGGFVKLMRAGKRVGLFNESIMKFVRIYVDDERMRDTVYRVWTTMRRFQPRLPQVKALIRENQVRVYLLFGRYDRIIQPSLGKPFVDGLEGFATMQVLDVGHQLLHPRNVEAIARGLEFCTSGKKGGEG
jgi:pimeloyl-ACP methyl ester carboxylesterase